MRTLPIFILSLFSLVAFAQQNVSISGKVIDKDSNLPMEYSIVYIQNAENSSAVYGGTTDENGFFSVSVPKGNYNIKIDFISYEAVELLNYAVQDEVDLGTLALAPISEVIEG